MPNKNPPSIPVATLEECLKTPGTHYQSPNYNGLTGWTPPPPQCSKCGTKEGKMWVETGGKTFCTLCAGHNSEIAKLTAQRDVLLRTVNQIGDFFEYQYICATPEEIKTTVMRFIDAGTIGLRKTTGKLPACAS